MAAALRACLAFGTLVLVFLPLTPASASAFDSSDSTLADPPSLATADSTLMGGGDTLGTDSWSTRTGSGLGDPSAAGHRGAFPFTHAPESDSSARRTSLATTIQDVAEVESYLFAFSSLGYVGHGAAVVAGVDALFAISLSLSKDDQASSRLSSTLYFATFMGLAVHMIRLHNDEVPKDRVVLHQFIGFNAAMLALSGIEALFKKKPAKPVPVAGSTPPSLADSSAVLR